MHQQLNHLIQALRNELQAYGEMSLRLDQHHQFIAHPAGDDFNESATKVQVQGAAIQVARRHRNRSQQAVARTLQLDVTIPIEKLIPSLPAEYQSLMIALLRANRELLAQVLQSIQRNRRLLASSLAWTQHYRNSVSQVGCAQRSSTVTRKSVRISVTDLAPSVCFEVKIQRKSIAASPAPEPLAPAPTHYAPARPAGPRQPATGLNLLGQLHTQFQKLLRISR